MSKRIMSLSNHYESLVIGSGQGGTPLAQAFAKAGQKTALVEATHVGGCCINEGCTPTKTMIASGRVAYLTRRSVEFGVNVGGLADVDMRTVRQRKRDIVESFRSGSEKRLKDAGLDLIYGTARFQDPHTISVKDSSGTDRVITADKIFIDTGGRPASPPIPGLDGNFRTNTVLDSTSIQELGIVPEHLLVIGGGYIGLEFGQLFHRLGAKVTIFQRGRQLLAREDPEIASKMLEILQDDGIHCHLQTSVERIEQAGHGDVAVTYGVGDAVESVRGSHVLVATGRRPNTDLLNLNAAKVDMDGRGYVKVDHYLQTSQKHIWGIGDVKGGPAFTHVSYDDYRILLANLLEHPDASQLCSIKDRELRIPYVVYTDPQLGHVGLHVDEAKKRYPTHTIKTAAMPMAYVARALETNESRGIMKAVVDADSDLILGFTCLGLEGGEVMSVVQMAMIGGTKWTALRDAVWAHPSLAESLNNLWNYMQDA